MALHLNISNSLSQLADNLCMELRHQSGNVFQPQYIVTQTEGMNNWLKLQIASNNGIAANISFLSPNEIIQKLYYFLGGKYPNILSAQNLSWLLFTILGDKDFTRRFPHVAAYYDHDDYDKDLKRMALAERTADLFDQYQIYRPEWIEDWNNEKLEEQTSEKWQQHLWIKAKELSRERLPDKTVIGKYIKDALKVPANQQKLQSKIPALHLFGLSITTDYHLELLFEVSKTANIHFHLVNPAPAVYWFEDRSEKQLAILSRKGLVDKSENNPGNTLLTSWGRVIQDTFMMLFKNEELLNSFSEVGIAEPAPDNLLHKIQNDIYNGASNDERNRVSLSAVSDGSVSISSCFTIAREVEVLYNWLVHLVDQKKEAMSPRDIVVMVTDIDAYAPYIKAVFKNAPYKFNFTIADESYSSSDTLISALTSILETNRHNFKAEAVIQLLDTVFISKRFGLSDIDRLRKLVSATNIRFGIRGRKEDDTRFVSWEYGIKRIMYGICISGGDEYIEPGGESLFPLDAIEGGDTREVIRFCHFVQVLIDSINERDRARTIAEWVSYIEKLIHSMLCEPESDAEEDNLLLQKQLKIFNIADEFMNEKIDFEIFAHSLLQSLSGAGRSGSFAGGGITFCSLIPMRSIPFKVVAVLGLNFDKFPRRERAASFNLIEKDKRRRGDRNVKENDKHLFLDTVLSAKDYLYLSYLGQSAKDNFTIPPSALVDELIDYIETSCDEPGHVRTTITVKHPLQSFSHKYGDSLPGYYNYLDDKKLGPVRTSDDKKQVEPFNFDEISIDNLVSFFKHPFKAYYNKVLDIYYNENQVLLDDTEIFELDSLQKWSLKPQLVSMDPLDTGSLQKRLVQTGGLPLKNMASVAVDELESEVAVVRNLLKSCVDEEREKVLEIEAIVDNSRVNGSISNIYGEKMVFVSYSKKENKYLLDAYIRYLSVIASGLNCQLYFISAKKEAIFQGSPVSQTEATKRLEKLVRLYKQGHETIVAYFSDFKINPDEVDVLDEKKLHKAFEEVLDNYKFPCTDQYLLNEMNNGYFRSADIVERYKENAVLLVKPLGEMFPGYYEK
ncbi:MAG: exodeoxyribonuclease V subunit gamma [Chitinophagaceae bacterium]